MGIHQWPVDNPIKGLVMRIFDVFSDVDLIKLLKQQSICLWFDALWSSCDVILKAKALLNGHNSVNMYILTLIYHHGGNLVVAGCAIHINVRTSGAACDDNAVVSIG